MPRPLTSGVLEMRSKTCFCCLSVRAWLRDAAPTWRDTSAVSSTLKCSPLHASGGSGKRGRICGPARQEPCCSASSGGRHSDACVGRAQGLLGSPSSPGSSAWTLRQTTSSRGAIRHRHLGGPELKSTTAFQKFRSTSRPAARNCPAHCAKPALQGANVKSSESTMVGGVLE